MPFMQDINFIRKRAHGQIYSWQKFMTEVLSNSVADCYLYFMHPITVKEENYGSAAIIIGYGVNFVDEYITRWLQMLAKWTFLAVYSLNKLSHFLLSVQVAQSDMKPMTAVHLSSQKRRPMNWISFSLWRRRYSSNFKKYRQYKKTLIFPRGSMLSSNRS